jgi:hypothetical protein
MSGFTELAEKLDEVLRLVKLGHPRCICERGYRTEKYEWHCEVHGFVENHEHGYRVHGDTGHPEHFVLKCRECDVEIAQCQCASSGKVIRYSLCVGCKERQGMEPYST